eukprot:10741498-Karenia_brevis.AAC.1
MINGVQATIQDKEETSSGQQHFTFAGKQLDDGHTPSNHSIMTDSTFHLELCLCRGMQILLKSSM